MSLLLASFLLASARVRVVWGGVGGWGTGPFQRGMLGKGQKLAPCAMELQMGHFMPLMGESGPVAVLG